MSSPNIIESIENKATEAGAATGRQELSQSSAPIQAPTAIPIAPTNGAQPC